MKIKVLIFFNFVDQSHYLAVKKKQTDRPVDRRYFAKYWYLKKYIVHDKNESNNTLNFKIG